MRYIRDCGSACLLVALWGLPADAATVRGTVADPAGLPIPGAAVKLNCRNARQSAVTDMEGRFQFTAIAGEGPCDLSVEHPQFAAYRETVSKTAQAIAIRIRMELAPLKQAVTVSANPQDVSPLERSTLGSVSLSEDQLKRISNNTEDLIRYAKLLAGGSDGPDAIYVDGLPAGALPAAQTIAGITVNSNPFSAEYSDGDQTHIEIITKNPDRQLRVNFSGGSLGAGGKNPLAGGGVPKSDSGSWNVSGPIPLLPISFSAQASLGSTTTPLAIEAVPPPVLFPGAEWASDSDKASSHNAAGNAHLYFYPTDNIRAHVSYSESRFSASNAGAGGLVLPEAASRSRFLTRDLLVSLRKTWNSLLFSGGMSYTGIATDSNANSSALGVTVAGAFTAGGAAMSGSTSEHASYTWKGAVQAENSRPWAAGITIGRADDGILQIPNPSGNLQFENTAAYTEALAGQNTGTWLVARSSGGVRYAGVTAAPFFQQRLLKGRNFIVTAGIRADYQSGYGIIPSPRVSAATEWHKFVIRSGGGLFVHNLPDTVLLHVLQNDGLHLQQFMAEDVSFANLAGVPLVGQDEIRARLAPGISRPRQFLEKSSIERPFGNFIGGVEYTWTRGEHLLGSRRLACDNGWLDYLESGRNSRLHRLHSQLIYKFGAQRLAAYYDWTDSRDDTSGPFSFPAEQNDIRAEWSRSAGIARRTFTSAAMFQLPCGISANLTESWHGSAPYNITTGLDVADDGLYTDRGGRPRNSGNGPDFSSVALYVSRRVALPKLAVRPRWRLALRLGLQAENLLDTRNYTSVGSVIGSPTFGQPLSALPGRAIRFWVNFD